jgi:hypothetical protein
MFFLIQTFREILIDIIHLKINLHLGNKKEKNTNPSYSRGTGAQPAMASTVPPPNRQGRW